MRWNLSSRTACSVLGAVMVTCLMLTGVAQVGAADNAATATANATGATGVTGTTPAAVTTSTSCSLPNGVPVTTTITPSGPTGVTSTAGTSGVSGATGGGTSGTATPPRAAPTYDLVESNGGVHTYGGAVYYGSLSANKKLPAPIIGGAIVPTGTGYWMAGAKGGIYNYGSAKFYGSAVHDKFSGTIAAIVATPDGGGYWLTTTKGAIYNFGDAGFCGSAVHDTLDGPIVAMAATPDGYGYWLTTAKGTVFNFGDAGVYTTTPAKRLRGKAVAIVSTSDGLGYWIATNKGSVYNFGDAEYFGSAATRHLARPITSMATTYDGLGYWLAEANGAIFQFGDAPFDGSLVHAPPKKPLAVVAIIPTVSSTVTPFVPLPHGKFGYDISNYQCTKPTASTVGKNLPPTAALMIIEAAGWLDSAHNSCLAQEAAYAKTAAGSTGAPYNLYLFLNSPSTSATATTLSASGPAGTCTTLPTAQQSSCQAYNYGYNGAIDAYNYATQQKVSAQTWWLDIENGTLSKTQYSNPSGGQYWSNNPALNQRTISGAYNALHGYGVVIGIYSTSIQYAKIAGDYSPTTTSIPLWIAGVPWTNPPFTKAGLPAPSSLAAWCAGTAKYAGTNTYDVFAGGVPWIVQETPGTLAAPYGIDPDYTC